MASTNSRGRSIARSTIVTIFLAWLFLSGRIAQLNAVSFPNVTELSSARVVVLYESILSTETVALTRRLTETHAEAVFRAHFKWGEDYCVYPKLADTIAQVRAVLPWIHFIGAISGAAFMIGDYWANGTLVTDDAKRQMLWMLPNGTMPRHFADPSRFYALDISKPLARQFILEYAYKSIDAGFDSLWFDEMWYVPRSGRIYGLELSDQPYMEAWKQIATAAKNYARAEYGRELLVSLNNGWVNAIGEPHPTDPWPNQDFITVSISLKTVETQSLLDDWAGYKTQIRRVYGRLPPLMVFLDWGKPPTPLSIFGNLPREIQIKMLKMLSEAAVREGALFVYPLHGGVISDYLSPGYTSVVYDAISQGTYTTITELTNRLRITTGTATDTSPLAKPISENGTETAKTNTTTEISGNWSIMTTVVIPIVAACVGLTAIMLKRKRPAEESTVQL